MVLHEQSDGISQIISLYESDLRTKGLPNIPLHTSPLMYSKDDYAGMDIQDRKRLLQSFFTMLQHMPIRYHTFSYKNGSPKDYRLAQAADLICALELAALRFEAGETAKTTTASSARMVTSRRTGSKRFAESCCK